MRSELKLCHLKANPLSIHRRTDIKLWKRGALRNDAGAESARHPPLSLFLTASRSPGPASSSHKVAAEPNPQSLTSQSSNPKPQMNPSCRSRGYQRVTLGAGIQNVIPLILDLGASLNLTIDFDEASQAAAALMPGREEIIWPSKVVSSGSAASAASAAQRWVMDHRLVSDY